MQPDDAPVSASPLSLAARLQRHYGADLDPRIDLGSGPKPRSQGESTSSAHPSSSTLQRLGERRGAATRYRLEGELARGGMGAILEVFDQDLRRHLAMKVILDRHDPQAAPDIGKVDPTLLARFLEEAQVTGQLDHPGVVPVHELGIDAAGRVYFTMRLVRGNDLEQICDFATRDHEGWTVTRALGVLLKVCEAMAYAHDKGVVHRDLKPANVMVGRFGEVYVMDWGLARVRGRASRPLTTTGRSLRNDGPAVATDRHDASTHDAGSELHTLDGDVVGTPSYMPPEQARGDQDSVDERADVYAVGAMLYRLLAGTAPYAQLGQATGGAAIWQRVLKEAPPSLETLAPDAPAELVAICQKAMQRDPTHRYASMQQLGDELRAFLEGRVVQAFATGAIATARKWVQRNRALAAALAATVLALCGGLAASLVFADRANGSAALAEARRQDADRNAALAETRRRDAEASAQLAEQRRSEALTSAQLAAQRQREAEASAAAAQRQSRIAQAVTAFLNDDLLAALAPEHQGKDVTVREVLDRASLQLGSQFAADPETEAALRTTIGTSYHRLGNLAAADTHLRRALTLRREHSGERSEAVLQSRRSLAGLHSERGELDAAITEYRAALQLAEEVLGAEHEGTLSTRSDLGIALAKAGRLDEARALYESTLPMMLSGQIEDSADAIALRNNLALLDQQQGRLAEAAVGMRSVLEWRETHQGERHPDTAVAMSNLSIVLGDLGQLDEAEQLARSSLELRLATLDEDHPSLARAHGNLGLVQLRRGRTAEAEREFRAALAIASVHQAADSPEVLTCKHNLASALDPQRQFDEALALRREVVEGRTRVLGLDHIDTFEAINSLGALYYVADRAAEAEPLYRQANAGFERILGADNPRTITTLDNVAGALLTLGKHADAEATTRKVLAARRRVLGEQHPDVARSLLNLGIAQRTRGDLAGAEQSLDEALAASRRAFGDAHLQVADCLRARADAHRKQEAWQAAVDDYREALRVRRGLRPDDSSAAFLLHQTAFCQSRLGQHGDAERGFTEALALGERLRGPDHASTRASLQMRARSLSALGRHDDAIAAGNELLLRTNRSTADDSPERQKVRSLLFELYTAAGRPEDAAKWQ